MSGRLPVAGGWECARLVWRSLAGRRLRLLGIILLFVAESACALVFPFVIGALVDRVAAGGTDLADVWLPAGVLVGSALAAGVLSWLGALALSRVAERVIADWREEYTATALRLDRPRVEAAGLGDVVTRAGDDIARLSEALPDTLPRFAVSVFTILLTAGGLATIDPWLLLGFAVLPLLHALTARWYLRTAPPVYTATRAAHAERAQQILGTLTNMPTVSAFRLQPRQLSRVAGATWQTVRGEMRARIVQNRLFGRLNLAEMTGLLTVLAVGVWLGAEGSLTAGAVTAAALLFLRIMGPVRALLFTLDDLQEALAALGRVAGVILLGAAREAPRGGDSGQRRDDPDPARPLVRLDSVDAGYAEGPPVLTGIDLEIMPGETVAVVGPTGSGKTTLAAVLAGVLPPAAGTIARGVGEHRIAGVTQQSHLFEGTVRENLALVAPETADGALHAHLDALDAGELLARLPDGLDTVIGSGGTALSGADAQRLALARVHLADPALVLLDEATAEAGTADAASLERVAARVCADRGALVIAHRLSQARSADRILVMEAGRIVEQGTHRELVALGGSYAGLWAAWSAGRE